MPRFAIALNTFLNEYDIPRQDVEELTGFPHVSLHNWISGRCEPAADVLPRMANALDLLCVDGGKILLTGWLTPQYQQRNVSSSPWVDADCPF